MKSTHQMSATGSEPGAGTARGAATSTSSTRPVSPPIGRIQWLPGALAAFVLAGTSTFFFKLALLKGVDLLLLNLTTSVLLLAVPYIVFLYRGTGLAVKVSRFAFISGLLNGVGQICYFGAISSGPVSLVAVLINFYPAATIAMSVIFLGERLSIRRICGVILAIAASILIFA